MGVEEKPIDRSVVSLPAPPAMVRGAPPAKEAAATPATTTSALAAADALAPPKAAAKPPAFSPVPAGGLWAPIVLEELANRVLGEIRGIRDALRREQALDRFILKLNEERGGIPKHHERDLKALETSLDARARQAGGGEGLLLRQLVEAVTNALEDRHLGL